MLSPPEARTAPLLALALLLSCSSGRTTERRATEPIADAQPTKADVSGDSSPQREAAVEASPAAPTCEQRLETIREQLSAAVAERRSCRWDHECVPVELSTSCVTLCPAPAVAEELIAARAAVAEVGGACEAYQRAGCDEHRRSCAEEVHFCDNGACASRLPAETAPEEPELTVPEQNARARDDDPPPRPPVGDAVERARRLFDAIVHDDPDRAADLYLPREPFLEIKGIDDPGGYWDRLYPRYRRDIHALHEALGDLEGAEFVRLELSRRGGWVGIREEGNRLPYWVSRHSWVYYRQGGQERRFEVRVLITWGERWFVTHLCEFHCQEPDCCQVE